MNMEYRSNSGSGSDSGPDVLWRLVMVIAVAATLLLALPALAIGVILQRLTWQRPWSFPLWLVLTFIGAGLTYYFYAHGLDRLVMAQLADFALAVKRHHADFARWDLPRLWSETWLVWLHTLVVAPVVAFWRELESHGRGDRAGFLHRQEQERERRVARSKSRAARRTRRPDRMPDAVNGHIVVGVPVDDEHAE